jgi:predicted RecA/RadA family phage recombinase
MKNFIQLGNTVSVTLAAAVASGDGVLVGSLFGVAATSGDIGDEIELQVTGVYKLPKTSANTPTKFAKAYWDNTAKSVTTTATDNTLIGVFMNALGSGTTSANVRLNGISV